jgi:SAM-dependent methyltransferase
MSSAESSSWAEHPELVDFFTHHRNRPEDLYPSESRFLPWLASQTRTVLDVGCAAGGFKHIWHHYAPDVAYVGVDVSASLIAAAKKSHPDVEFHQGDCATGLPFSDRFAPVTQALGWLHMEPRYRSALLELWRVTDRYLFFDVRLAITPDQAGVGRQKIAYYARWDEATTSPYIVLAWPVFASMIMSLEPERVLGFGYSERPADAVEGFDQEINFGMFVLEKPPDGAAPVAPTVCIDMPLVWPSMDGRVHLLDPSRLDDLVPRSGL